MKPVARRDFARGLALAGIALPFLRILGIDPLAARVAKAGPTVAPKRFVYWYTPDGITNWAKDLGQINTGPTDFSLGNMTSTPFAALKQDLVMIQGVDMLTNNVADTHEQGMVLNLTAEGFAATCGSTKDCVGNGGIYGVTNGSLDQYIGSKMTTPFKSVQLAAQPNNGLTLSFNPPPSGGPYTGFDVQPNPDPVNAFNTLFAQISNGPNPALVLENTLRMSVLDNVTSELSALQSRLGSEDRQKLQAHLQSIRDLEGQLATPPAACTKPAAPVTPASGLDDASNYPWIIQSHAAVAAAALACDLTRVVVIQNRGCYSSLSAPWAPINQGGDNWHDMSHLSQGYQAFVDWKQYLYQELANFAMLLKNTPEPGGNGESILDNTIILTNSDIAEGHTHVNATTMTLGGKNLGVNTGQFIAFGNNHQPYANLLVSILNAVGINDTSFASTSTGPLPAGQGGALFLDP